MRNLLSSLFLFLARAAAVMVQLRMVEHWFGPAYSGLNVLLNQVTYYVLIAELGLSAATLSLLFEPVHRGDHARAAALIHALRIAVHRVILVTAPIAVLLLALYAFHLSQQLPYSVVLGASLLSAASSFLTLLALPYQSYINASDRIFEVNLVFGIGFVVKTALGLAAAWFTHTYLALVLMYPCISFVEMLLLRSRAHSMLPPVTPSLLAQASLDIRAKAKFVLLHRIGGLIYYQSDFIILSLAAPLAVVSAYAHYQYLAAGLIGLFTACITSMTTRVAREQMGLDTHSRVDLYVVISRLFLFSSIACAILFLAISQDLVSLLFHAGPLTGSVPTLLAVLLLLNLCRGGDDVWINATGVFEIGSAFPIFEAALYVALGIILVPKLGIAGILLAGITTNLIFCVGLRPFILSRGVFHVSISAMFAARARALAKAFPLGVPLLLLLAPWRAILPAIWVHASTLSFFGGLYLIVVTLWLARKLRQPAMRPAYISTPIPGTGQAG